MNKQDQEQAMRVQDYVHSVQEKLYIINDRMQFYPEFFSKWDHGFIKSLSRPGRCLVSLSEKQSDAVGRILDIALADELNPVA